MKSLKIQISPSETVNIELSGKETETELKDLFACLVRCSPNEIKGIKDNENNYYTLSSLISNKEINSKTNKKIFQLILKNKNFENCFANEKQNFINFCKDDFLNNENRILQQNDLDKIYNGNLMKNGYEYVNSSFIQADPVYGKRNNKSLNKKFVEENRINNKVCNYNNKFINYSNKIISKTRNFFENKNNNNNNNNENSNHDLFPENNKERSFTGTVGETDYYKKYLESGNFEIRNFPTQNKNYNNYNCLEPFNDNFSKESYNFNSINLYRLNELNKLDFLTDNFRNKENFKETFFLKAKKKDINIYKNNDEQINNYVNLGDFNRSELIKENPTTNIFPNQMANIKNKNSKSAIKIITNKTNINEIYDNYQNESRRSNLISANTNKINFNNNPQNLSINSNTKKNHFQSRKVSNDNFSYAQEKQISFNLKTDFLNYLHKIFTLNLISSEAYETISLNCAKGNQNDFLELYKIYLQKIIDKNSFLNSILKLADKNKGINLNADKFSFEEFKFQQNLIETVKRINPVYFDDAGDLNILFNLVELKNEILNSAYEFYLLDKNYLKFLNALKTLVCDYRKKTNQHFRILNKLESSSNYTNEININNTNANNNNTNNNYFNTTSNFNCELKKYVSSKSKILNEEMKQLQYSPVKKPITLVTKNSESLNINISNNNNNDNNNINNNVEINNNHYNSYNPITYNNKKINVNAPAAANNIDKLTNKVYSTPKTEVKTGSEKTLSHNNITNNIFFESTRTDSKAGNANNSNSKGLEVNAKQKISEYSDLQIKADNESYSLNNKIFKETKVLNFLNCVENTNLEKNSFYEATLTEKNNVLLTQTITFNSNISENLYFQTIQYTTLTKESNELISDNENKNENCSSEFNPDQFYLESQSSIENKTNNFNYKQITKLDKNENKKEKEKAKESFKNNKDKEPKYKNELNSVKVNIKELYHADKNSNRDFSNNYIKKINNNPMEKSNNSFFKDVEIKIFEFKKFIRNANLFDTQDLNFISNLADEKNQDLIALIDEFLDEGNTTKLKKCIQLILNNLKKSNSNKNYSNIYNNDNNNSIITYSCVSENERSISEKLNLNENESIQTSTLKEEVKSPKKKLSEKTYLKLQVEKNPISNNKNEILNSNKKYSLDKKNVILKSETNKTLNYFNINNEKIQISTVEKKLDLLENNYNSTHSNLKTLENEHCFSNNHSNYQITFSKNPDFSCDKRSNSKNKSIMSTDNSHEFQNNFKANLFEAAGNKFNTEVKLVRNSFQINNAINNSNSNSQIDSLFKNNLQKKFDDFDLLNSNNNNNLDEKGNLAPNNIIHYNPLFSFNNKFICANNLNFETNNENNSNKNIENEKVNVKKPAYLAVAKLKSSDNKNKENINVITKDKEDKDLNTNEIEDDNSTNTNIDMMFKLDSKENILIFNNISSKILMKSELEKENSYEYLTEKEKIKNNNNDNNNINIQAIEVVYSKKQEEAKAKAKKSNSIKQNEKFLKTSFFGNKEKPKSSCLSKQNYSCLKEVLFNLEISGTISNHTKKYVLSKYAQRDETLLSAWEVYEFNKNIEDLIETLKLFSSNARKPKSLYCKGSGFTPSSLTNEKSEILNFLKNKEKDEKRILFEKQMNVIELLAKENLIENSKLEILKKFIFEENLFLISAFEILSVAKDFWDFAETIELIADNCFINSESDFEKQETKKEACDDFNFKEESEDQKDFGIMHITQYNDLKEEKTIWENKENGNQKNEKNNLKFEYKKIYNRNFNEEFIDEGKRNFVENNNLYYVCNEESNFIFKSLENVKQENEYLTKLKQTFNCFIECYYKEFKDFELQLLDKKLEEKNEFLMSSIEFYEMSKDKDEFLDNLRILIKD